MTPPLHLTDCTIFAFHLKYPPNMAQPVATEYLSDLLQFGRLPLGFAACLLGGGIFVILSLMGAVSPY